VSHRTFWAFSLLCLVVLLLALDLLVAFVVIDQRNHTINSLGATNQTLSNALADAKNKPEYTVWTSCAGPCTMNPTQVRAGGAPDTFDTIISFTSTTPISVHFMTLEGWAEFSACNFKISCITPRFYDLSLGPTTSLTDYVFKDAEGCASYVVVFQSAGTGIITPDERVRYHPASAATGACA
jgi:hypothetical protein